MPSHIILQITQSHRPHSPQLHAGLHGRSVLTSPAREAGYCHRQASRLPGNSSDATAFNALSGWWLGVMYQHGVPIETGTGDRWSTAEASMRAVPVVVMEPARKMRRALFRGVVGASIGPLAQGGL